jgi:hypothetical protein
MSENRKWSRLDSHVSHVTLYHASLQVNTFLIKQHGLLTSEDERGKGRIWLATRTELDFIISHLMARRGLSVAQWTIWEVRADLLPSWPLRSGREGVYYVKTDISPEHIRIFETKWFGFDLDEFPHDDNAVYVYSEPLGKYRPA